MSFENYVYLCKVIKFPPFGGVLATFRLMKDRIKEIMESQHMTQQVFASFLGMSPASLSSIFNGRTKPTLNIVDAIKKKLPGISTDWLLFGTGQMFLDPKAGDSPSVDSPDQPVQEPMIDFGSDKTPPTIPQNPPLSFSSVNPTPKTIEKTQIKYIDKPQRHVTEIRVFYDDQTWESFVPKK